jgi:hypothetical protein
LTTRKLEDLADCELCCAWIAPDGKASHLNFSVPGEGSHCTLAEYVLKDDTGGRGLDAKGFLHLSGGGPYMGRAGHEPTQAQLDTLFDIQQEMVRRGQIAKAGYVQSFLDLKLTAVTS